MKIYVSTIIREDLNEFATRELKRIGMGAEGHVFSTGNYAIKKIIANEKAERKAERQMPHGFQRQDLRGLFESPMSSDMSNNGQIDMNLNRLQAGRKAKLDNRLARLLDAFRVNPTLGISDAARALDVSRQTIYSYMDQLEHSGKIRRNGHGVEVLE